MKKPGHKDGTGKETDAGPSEEDLEKKACVPVPIRNDGFNPAAMLPYGLNLDHVSQLLNEFINFLGFINTQLNSKGIERFESMLMPANFSSMVGEFIGSSIPKYCNTLARNRYHNGHPDLLPNGQFPGNALQHGTEGIEVKASRYFRGWQGHNAEACWLLIFVFDANRPSDAAKQIAPRPFHFRKAYLGQLTKDDWVFSGRKEGSRRTITAAVTKTGFEKLTKNWVYDDDLGKR